MPRILNVHLLPQLADPRELAGHTTVVIDVLRASTTIVHALAAGAVAIVPCVEVGEARQLARARPGALLGGEREGRQIAGFDLGNSPREYTPDRVGGRSIVFTTTNGTRALHACIGSAQVLIGALVNLTAVCRLLQDEPQVDLLCAGTHGGISRDDALVAGAIVNRMIREDAAGPYQPNDQALLCEQAWRQSVGPNAEASKVADSLRDTAGGRNLIAIGHDYDLELAAQIDRFDIVPRLDRANWRVCLASA